MPKKSHLRLTVNLLSESAYIALRKVSTLLRSPNCHKPVQSPEPSSIYGHCYCYRGELGFDLSCIAKWKPRRCSDLIVAHLLDNPRYRGGERVQIIDFPSCFEFLGHIRQNVLPTMSWMIACTWFPLSSRLLKKGLPSPAYHDIAVLNLAMIL